MHAALAPESRILLAAASAANPTQRLQRLEALLAQPWDLDRLLAQTTKHRLASLLDWHLERLPACGTRGLELRSALRALRRQSAIQSLQLTHELIQLIALLRDRGIPVLTYKGPALAGLLYEEVAQRHFWDLDVFVPRESVLDAKNILLARGYRPERELGAEDEQRHLETDCEYNFDHPRSGAHVELHWDVLDAPRGRALERSVLWESPIAVTIAGQTIDTFALEVQLVALSVHGGEKHRWKRLKWLGDIARLTHKSDLDWSRAMSLAENSDQLDVVLLGLYLVHRLLDAKVPADVLELVVERPRIIAQATLLMGQFFGDENAGLPGYRSWRQLVQAHNRDVEDEAAVDPAWWRYLQTVCTPGWRERRRWRLPSLLGFLYYVLRPYMLVREHGLSGLLRRLR